MSINSEYKGLPQMLDVWTLHICLEGREISWQLKNVFSVIKKNIEIYIFSICTVQISIMQNVEKSNGMEVKG